MRTSRLTLSSLLLALTLWGGSALAATIGQQLSNPEIRDANNNPAHIPDLGTKVIAMFYTDPDVSDQNDPFADALKAADLDETVYRGMGVANLKETWLPNTIIRSIIRKKIEKYDATILTDPDRLLATAWDLGDCAEASVAIIIDKQGRLQYIKKGALTQAEIDAGLAMVKRLMAE